MRIAAPLDAFIRRKQLTANEKQTLARIQQTWRQAMAQATLAGKDLERDLIDFMEQHQGEFYRHGGLSPADRVPAMLTPGEYVVNRQAVARFGAGFFEALNDLSLPARALALHVQGFAAGGLVAPLGGPLSRPLSRPVLPAESSPTRTVRVELAAGDRKVTAHGRRARRSAPVELFWKSPARGPVEPSRSFCPNPC
jgi:hypothetical protein